MGSQDLHDHYGRLLGLRSPWKVTGVEFDSSASRVMIDVEHSKEKPPCCPSCQKPGSRKDSRLREWRHLDVYQYTSVIRCWVPRVRCAEHGVHQIHVPWAEPGSRFTALFESLVIDWLLEASILAVARNWNLSWDQVEGIQARAVKRGLSRRERQPAPRLGVDETSFQKRHEYVTVVTDLDGGFVQYVGDDRKKGSLEAYYASLPEKERIQIQCVAMDMWDPYIAATKDWIPGAGSKICFDKFHVAKQLGDAVNQVRLEEHRKLMQQGEARLKGTKYLFLQNPQHMPRSRWRSFQDIREGNFKTSRAWHLKETAMDLWHYVYRGWAQKSWKRWIGWAMRSRLDPMKKAARTVRKYLYGILNAITRKVTNAKSESVNSKIQWIKRTAYGYRNRERFRNAIYFHCGGLDLYPKLR